jgi:hypothetical protein
MEIRSSTRIKDELYSLIPCTYKIESHGALLYAHTRCTSKLQDHCLMHTEDVHVPRLLVLQQHQLYFGHAVHCDYSSPGRTGSTSTLPCAASTRLSAAAALHRLRRTPPRRRLLGIRLPRRLTSTSLNQKTSRGRLPRHQQLVGSTSN